jgi:hypothetical protein
VAWSRAKWIGAEWRGEERSGAQWRGVERSGMEWSGVAWSGCIAADSLSWVMWAYGQIQLIMVRHLLTIRTGTSSLRRKGLNKYRSAACAAHSWRADCGPYFLISSPQTAHIVTVFAVLTPVTICCTMVIQFATFWAVHFSGALSVVFV